MANNFIQQFEASMQRLADVRRNIQANFQIKEQFSNTVKEGLTQINARLRDLAGQVGALKQTADNLQGQIDTNANSIGDKDRQIQECRTLVEQLRGEREAAYAQLNQARVEMANQIDELQRRINELEGQLRNVTAERDSIRNELQGRGDMAQQHATELQRQSEAAEQQQRELTDRINQLDSRIQELERQINEKDAAIAEQGRNTSQATSQLQTQVEQLNAEKRQLEAQNENLIQRLIQATQAINEAVDQLDAISRGVPNATTQTEVNQLLQEIEQSLENISRAIQGQRAAAAIPAQVPAQGSRIPGNSEVTVLQRDGTPINIRLNAIISQLEAKMRQSEINRRPDSKYVRAYNAIRNADDANEVSNILRQAGVDFNANGQVKGGKRKTKKVKNQRGGFIYSNTSRRRISSTMKSSRLSKSSKASKSSIKSSRNSTSR